MHPATPTLQPPAALAAAALAFPDLGAEMAWRPLSGGRTNRLWRVGPLVVKLYRPDQATPLFPNDPEAEVSTLRHLAPEGLAPVPVRRLSGGFGQALVYRFLDGPVGHGDPVALARVLHRVHSAAPPPVRPLPSGSEALLTEIRALLSTIRAAPPGVAEALAHLSARPPVPATEPRLIHTDPVPANVVTTCSGPVLIDWQCPALGDPCEDLAMVMSPSMRAGYDGALGAAEDAAFLAAYPEPEVVARYRRLAPFHHLKMAAYAQWSRENGRATPEGAVESELAALRRALTRAAG